MTQYDHALRLLRITRVEVVPVPRSRSPVGLRLSRRRRQEEGFRGAPGIAGDSTGNGAEWAEWADSTGNQQSHNKVSTETSLSQKVNHVE